MKEMIVSQTKEISENLFSRERVELIKKTVAQGASDLELQLFVEQCKRTGLDPITRQIYFIKNPRDGKVQIQTSIDGFRLVAERSGLYEGQTAPQWCGEDGVWCDVWLSSEPPMACKIGVYKRNFREALVAVALFDEYAQKKHDGSPTFMWAKMPSLMIAKVAESLALRKAFPNDLSGLYTTEEMEQASQVPDAPAPITIVKMPAPAEAPKPQSVSEPAEWQAYMDRADAAPNLASDAQESVIAVDDPYTVPFGQFSGKRLSQIELGALRSYYDYCQRTATQQAEKEGRAVRPAMAEFLRQTETFLANR
jgi:phage recombination protein Bet